MSTPSKTLTDMSDHEQCSALLACALSSAPIGDGTIYRDLVERLQTDEQFESDFRGTLKGFNLVLFGSSMDHGIAIGQGDEQKSIFCASRSDFTDGRVTGYKQRRLSYVRMAAIIAVCAAAYPKNAQNGERELVSFTAEDAVLLMRKAASEAILPDADEPAYLPEAEEIIASVIQDAPSDDRVDGAIRSIKSNAQKTIDTLVALGYLIARPADADGVVDYSPHWKMTKLVQHLANKTLVATLRNAA